MRTQNPRSELVGLFHDEYADELRKDDDVDFDAALKSMESVETYLRLEWREDAIREINGVEDRYGIDMKSLLSGTQSTRLADPR